MSNPTQIIAEFVHEHDTRSSNHERIRLYRALATTTADLRLACHFHECADDLAAAEEKIGQLALSFGVPRLDPPRPATPSRRGFWAWLRRR